MANISVFLKNNISKLLFIESQHKKINSLLEKSIFKVILISNIFSKVKIFNSCFINEIKNKKIVIAFKKSGFVVHAYNNHSKKEILP